MLKYDTKTQTTSIKLHVPCGVVDVSVPTLTSGKADPSRPVSFISVPSFATGVSLTVRLREESRWPELDGRDSILYYGSLFATVAPTTV